uniref:Transcriptional adapter 2-alpha n=1 Tax=Sipha flava TaxID=143950 RepID=A0A2S2QLR2_9HEMI
MFSKKKLSCRFCFTDLWHEHAFIKCNTDICVKLNINICLQCFSTGTEDHVHKNTDPYKVLSNAVQIGDLLWHAHEEIILLDTFMNTMSWAKVAQKLGRSTEECECHYFKNYVLNPKIKGLEHINRNAFRLHKFNKAIECKPKTMDNELDSEESYHQYEVAMRLAGYQPACGTFEEEYDDQAEDVIQLLNEPIWIDQETKLSLESNLIQQKMNEVIMDIFIDRLQERYRRKQLVKDYGLVEYNKHQLWIKSMEVVILVSHNL